MSSRLDFDDYFLNIAVAVSKRGDCTRSQVGAVLVSEDHRILGTGYNGAPAGQPGCLSDGACPRGQFGYSVIPTGTPYDNCIALHAEANALLWAGQSCRGARIYITRQPCGDCKKLLAGAGVVEVISP